MKDLGSLVPGGYGFARDLNDSGQVVGWADSGQVDANHNPIQHAFLWTAGGTDGVPSNPQMKDLQVTNGGNRGFPYLAINNSGVVVGEEATNAGPDRAFIWDQTRGVRDLNDLVPSNLGAELRNATDVNKQGQIVANGYDGSTWHAYLLSDTNGDGDYQDSKEVTDLGRLPGATSTSASAINDVGQIAGASGTDPFRWQNGHMKDLGYLAKPNLQVTPGPTGINLGGYVVGNSILNFAWVWIGSGKIQDLNTLIPSNSGWDLNVAWGINKAGTIVGYGTPPSGGPTHAFLVTQTSLSAAAATTTAGLTDAKTPNLAPVEAGARSPHSLTVALPSSAGPQDSPILIGLTPASDQDFTLVVTELIHSVTKRPRPSLWG
jgi:probable HAF family extracellular repeat protein